MGTIFNILVAIFPTFIQNLWFTHHFNFLTRIRVSLCLLYQFDQEKIFHISPKSSTYSFHTWNSTIIKTIEINEMFHDNNSHNNTVFSLSIQHLTLLNLTFCISNWMIFISNSAFYTLNSTSNNLQHSTLYLPIFKFVVRNVKFEV